MRNTNYHTVVVIVNGVTDTDCEAQNGNTHVRVFRHFQPPIVYKQEQKLSVNCIYILFLSIRPVTSLWFGFTFNNQRPYSSLLLILSYVLYLQMKFVL